MAESTLAPSAAEAEPDDNNLSPANLSDRAWMQSLLRPALIAVAAVCIVVAMMAFVRRLVPGLPAVYTELLIGIGALASIIGSISTTWLSQPGQRSKRNIGYRAAEYGLILGVTRLGTWAATNQWPDPEQFLLRPMDALLDGYFILGLVVITLAWAMSTAMTEDLLALALQPDDLYAARTYSDRWQDTARPVYTDRPAILRRFVARWVVGGVILVILAAGSRYDLPENGFLGIIRQRIDPAVVAAIIIYFLVGLVLISQGQLALLRARWVLQRTPSVAGVLQNWPIYAFLLILVLGIVAALLPLGGTFYLAQILTAILAAIYNTIFGIFRFFLSLMLLLMSWLTGEPVQEAPPPPPPMPTLAPQVAPAAESIIPPWTGGAIFWLFALALLGYAAYIYFSGKGNLGWLHRFWAMLRMRWLTLFGAYRQWQAARARANAGSAEELLARGRGGWPAWLRLRGLDPNAQVRYYYLSILHRAQEAGLPRHEAETPLHYAPRLAQHLEADNAQADNMKRQAITELTEAFVQVRYAGTPIAPEQLNQVKRVWQQIKRYLRL